MVAHMMVSFAPAAALTLLQQAPVGRHMSMHPGSRPLVASMTVQTAGACTRCLLIVHRRQQPGSPTALEIGVVAHSPAGKSTATVRWTGESAEDSKWGCCGAHAVGLKMPTCGVCPGSQDHTYRAIVSGAAVVLQSLTRPQAFVQRVDCQLAVSLSCPIQFQCWLHWRSWASVVSVPSRCSTAAGLPIPYVVPAY